MAVRGIRNNNPLNIRKGNKWQGERENQTDPVFEEFISMEYGLRAGLKLMKNYIEGRTATRIKYNTISKLVSRWAPPIENATNSYIKFVADSVGINPLEVIDFKNKSLMVGICAAMVRVECGTIIDKNIIESAYDML